MPGDDNLPVILVSAADTPSASAIISELKHDGTEPQCNGVSHDSDEEQDSAPVWHLTNKYYSASVCLRALADSCEPDPGDDVQAHIIYLTEDECSDDTACVRRAAAARASRNAVRLIAAQIDHEPPALATWARTSHYELVPLLAPPVDQDEDFPETTGVARLREALHAHAWPGMRRAGAVRAPAPDLNDDSSSDSSSWGSWTGADEAGAVERAEQFADALAMLPARRAEGDDDAARRLHAEQLVVAFCRALGHDLNLDGDL